MLIVLVGPTMSGKTTLMNELVKDERVEKLITHTTRPMRVEEVDGVDYFFHKTIVNSRNTLALREYKAINNDNKKEKWLYWINKKDIKRDKTQVVVLDPKGVEDLQKTIKDIHIVLLNPDPRVIDSRIKHSSRSGENINETNRRLNSDLVEIALWEARFNKSGSESPFTMLIGDNLQNNKEFVLKEVFGDDRN